MSNKKINCCYFPTTTILVDDDPELLMMVGKKLSRFSPCQTYSDPVGALEYINHKYEQKPFYDKFYIKQDAVEAQKNHRIIQVDFANIYKQIYDASRFSEITGLLVDYAMPGLNGREFCKRALADCGWRNWNNIVLLTGEARAEIAVDMIKERIINGYIYKGDVGYLDELLQTLKTRQLDYFEQKSELFIDIIVGSASLDGLRPSCLKDPAFIEFFNKMVEKYKPVEYYLVNNSGSYIFLSDDGKVSWLIVQSEDDMECSEFDMRGDESVPAEVYSAIRDRKAIRYFFNEELYPRVTSPDEWGKFIHPAQTLKGISNYYYSFVENPLAETFIDSDKVVSYNAFRSSTHGGQN